MRSGQERVFPDGDHVGRFSIRPPGLASRLHRDLLRRGIIVQHYQQVDVAIRSGFPAGHRTEQDYTARPKPGHDRVEKFGRDERVGHATAGEVAEHASFSTGDPAGEIYRPAERNGAGPSVSPRWITPEYPDRRVPAPAACK